MCSDPLGGPACLGSYPASLSLDCLGSNVAERGVGCEYIPNPGSKEPPMSRMLGDGVG
jgi:hypothetical protein